jgi:hypothetical protein
MSLPHVHKTARETALRAAANRRADGACDVLADFYEVDGQLSRAALWRRTINGERDLLVKRHDGIHPVDPRRNAMIWALVVQGMADFADRDAPVTLAAVASHFGLTARTIATIVARIDHKIASASMREIREPTLAATERLIAAGALRVPAERVPAERIP